MSLTSYKINASLPTYHMYTFIASCVHMHMTRAGRPCLVFSPPNKFHLPTPLNVTMLTC